MNKQKNLTIREFSKIHGVGRRTVAMWCGAGKIPGAFLEATPFGDVWFIPQSASDNFDRDVLPKKGRPRQQKELKAA
ncbi:MAG TPA: hypothetical protein VIL74_07220 [Pyrinomonadaceae bacterium]|jgi:hypothetical protein